MKKLVLVGLLALTTIFGISQAIESEITVEYEALQTKSGKSAIKAVRFRNKELSHLVITDLLDEKQKEVHAKKDSERKSWNRLTIAQTAIYMASAAAFIKHYINDDTVVKLKQTPFMQNVVQNGNKNYFKLGVSGALVASAIYPFVRYFRYFGMNSLDFYFPVEEIDGKVAVLRKKIYSHTVFYGDTPVHIYKQSDPIGYMTVKE